MYINTGIYAMAEEIAVGCKHIHICIRICPYIFICICIYTGVYAMAEEIEVGHTVGGVLASTYMNIGMYILIYST
jgi:hypothetical protein